ncbi:2'-5' RNA ligase family protein [Phycicoccus avicenniae]|uniref:2'-5' RNA ligase family protein n=1 Tax=Phycicoccus avicenniae TaxID=2828860 RepID=UPI003D28507C
MPIHGVAVTVPEPWGSRLQQAREQAGDPMAAAIPPHVTLLPPTAVEPAEVPAFAAHLEAVCAGSAPFEMVLSGTGTFRPVSPVVFVQVSRGIAECERLESAVRSGPVERHLDFPYHPHVTIAHHLGDDALDGAFDGLADFRCTFTVESVELYHHDPDGVWRVIRSFPLAGRADA